MRSISAGVRHGPPRLAGKAWSSPARPEFAGPARPEERRQRLELAGKAPFAGNVANWLTEG